MKIAIVISGNAFRSHLGFYIRFLEKQRIDYDLICWNRKLINEPGTVSYNVEQSEQKGYFKRFYAYLGYKKFVTDCLTKNKYDGIIISTIAIAVLLFPFLKSKYGKKYVFDIRDYSIIVKFSWVVFTRLIDNSIATVVSSSGFIQWLPKSSKYYIAHNFPFELTSENGSFIYKNQQLNKNTKSFEITTIGSLRDYEANKMIIDAFKNSKQFKLKFIGSGPASEPLKEYVLDSKVSNVSFKGFYKKEDEATLLCKSNFINNFTNYDLNSRTLMTNRFYLSVVLSIPMIVRFGTYQAEICERYNLGCIVKPKLDIEAQLKDYIKTFNENDFKNGCKDFLKVVENDTNNIKNVLLDFAT